LIRPLLHCSPIILPSLPPPLHDNPFLLLFQSLVVNLPVLGRLFGGSTLNLGGRTLNLLLGCFLFQQLQQPLLRVIYCPLPRLYAFLFLLKLVAFRLQVGVLEPPFLALILMLLLQILHLLLVSVVPFFPLLRLPFLGIVAFFGCLDLAKELFDCC
jgi:hypothetical protein